MLILKVFPDLYKMNDSFINHRRKLKYLLGWLIEFNGVIKPFHSVNMCDNIFIL